MIRIAIDGPSGAGKSTVAKRIAHDLSIIYVDTGAMYRCIGLYVLRQGLDTKNEKQVLPCLAQIELHTTYDPQAGQRIFLNGEDIMDYDINHRANAGIGYAFQQPPRFKGMTVQRLLALAAGREMSDVECCKLLSDVGLCAEEYLNRQIDGTLSGGEMKRIEIATVLAKEHTLCIFDEPEAGIDLWSFSMLIHKFEEIHKEKKQSLIVISHQEKIISMADRIMVIDDGKIKAEGLREDVLPCLNGLDKCHTCAGKAGVRA